MSGLGFESGGLSGAHAIHDGLTTLEQTHALTHGEKVAYGTLTQLMLEGADQDRYNKYFKLILSLGLPTTLADLHLENATDEELLAAGKAACSENDTIDRLHSRLNQTMLPRHSERLIHTPKNTWKPTNKIQSMPNSKSSL